MNTQWKDMTPMEKVGLVVVCIAALLVAIAGSDPDLFPVNITYPAIIVATLVEALAYWKKNRKMAYLLIVGAVICLAGFLLDLCLL